MVHSLLTESWDVGKGSEIGPSVPATSNCKTRHQHFGKMWLLLQSLGHGFTRGGDRVQLERRVFVLKIEKVIHNRVDLFAVFKKTGRIPLPSCFLLFGKPCVAAFRCELLCKLGYNPCCRTIEGREALDNCWKVSRWVE